MEVPVPDEHVLDRFHRDARQAAGDSATSQTFYHVVRERAVRLAEQEQSEEANTRSRRYGAASFYWLLGVAQDDRPVTIERAYRDYVATNHPDRFMARPERRGGPGRRAR